MNWFEALLLGLLQGITEFLPVSSSGHLVILQELLQLNTSAADNLLFDVAVHGATVCSTIVVLRREIADLFVGTFATAVWNDAKRYVVTLLISMIPVFVVGMFFKDKVETFFGSGLLIVGICLIITALLLLFSYFAKPRQKEHISNRDAFIIGIGQAVAVLPGLSRSGTTIAIGLLLGDKKDQVAKFSFLMVLIPILGEMLLTIIDLATGSEVVTTIGLLPLIVGFLTAFIAGCVVCKFMIELVKRGKLIWFAVYCAVVGLTVLIATLCIN